MRLAKPNSAGAVTVVPAHNSAAAVFITLLTCGIGSDIDCSGIDSITIFISGSGIGSINIFISFRRV
jgi:hypothetical protein